MHQIDAEIYRMWKAAQNNGIAEVEASISNFRKIMQALAEDDSTSVAKSED